MVSRTVYREKRVERLSVVSMALRLDKIRDKSCSAATHEVINLLNQEKFMIYVFKEKIKSSGDCQVITEDVIDRWKDC